jgi:hypothetical protein
MSAVMKVSDEASTDEVARILSGPAGESFAAADRAARTAALSLETAQEVAGQIGAPRLAQACSAVMTELVEAQGRITAVALTVEREQVAAEVWGRLTEPRAGPTHGPTPAGSEASAAPVALTRPTRPVDPSATPRGLPEPIKPQDDEATRNGHLRENDSAALLARLGYDIEQKPQVPGRKKPDYRIEGEIFDHVAPTTDRALNIYDRVEEKVTERQAKRVVVKLDHTTVRLDDLREVFRTPMAGLQEVLVIRCGEVRRLFP